MEKTIDATYDGEVFRPDEPIDLASNTKVTLTVNEKPKKERLELVEMPKKPGGKPYAFLEYSRSLNLDGPSDFSTNLDDYLYHGKPLPDEE
jgi:predicted DNA-binding antitoxin AbrB/MazE fold protein